MNRFDTRSMEGPAPACAAIAASARRRPVGPLSAHARLSARARTLAAGITLILAAAGVAVLAPSPARAQSGKIIEAAVPVDPDKLFVLLPKAQIAGWKLIESFAENEYSSWLSSSAFRTYERLPKPGASAEEAQPATIEVGVIDTGRHPSFLGRFRDFQVGKFGNVENVMIGDYPASVIGMGSEGTLIQLLAGKRFLFEFLARGLEVADVKPWIKACNLAAVSKLPFKPVRELPARYMKVYIDELNPDNNISHLTSHTSIKNAEERGLAEIEAAVAEGIMTPEEAAAAAGTGEGEGEEEKPPQPPVAP